MFSFFLNIYLDGELGVIWEQYVKDFEKLSYCFPLFHIPTSSVGGFQFLCVLVNISYFSLKKDSHPNKYGVILHCDLPSSIFKLIPTKYNLFNPAKKGLFKIKINF